MQILVLLWFLYGFVYRPLASIANLCQRTLNGHQSLVMFSVNVPSAVEGLGLEASRSKAGGWG